MNRKNEVLIFGAGALSLGFLGPELAEDYALTFVDIDTKKELLLHLRQKKEYFVNISGPSPEFLKITGVNGLNLEISGEREEIVRKIVSAGIVFTAVGAKNLESLTPLICEGLTKRFKKNKEKLYLFCTENGRNVAEKFQSCLQSFLKTPLPSQIRIGNTVMGRMCRIEAGVSDNEDVRPVFKNSGWAVVAEPFFGIPIKKSLVESDTCFSDAFQIEEDKRFETLDDIKFFAHNGGHAFLGYLGYLKNYKYYPELSKDRYLMNLAARMLDEEIVGALISKHKNAVDRNDYRNYIANLLRRMTCPSFNDSIERGVRGSLEKLRSDERLISGAGFVLSQGFIPKIYSLTIAAAIMINIDNKNLAGNLDKILTDYCGLDQKKDRKLFNLIKSSYRSLKTKRGSLRRERRTCGQ